MPDIKIDITQVLRDYFIPLMIGLFVGLLSRALFFDSWLWPAIIAIGSFLLVELLIWADKAISKIITQKKRQLEKEIEANRIKETDTIRAIAFYNSLNDSDKQLAMDIFDYPQKTNSSKFERFIDPDSGVAHQFSYRLSAFSRSTECDKMPYIALVNYEDCTYKGALQHVIIQPAFYSILEQNKRDNLQL